MIAKWLTEILNLTIIIIIRASVAQLEKLLYPVLPVRGPKSKPSWKQVTGHTLPQFVGTTSDACLQGY